MAVELPPDDDGPCIGIAQGLLSMEPIATPAKQPTVRLPDLECLGLLRADLFWNNHINVKIGGYLSH